MDIENYVASHNIGRSDIISLVNILEPVSFFSSAGAGRGESGGGAADWRVQVKCGRVSEGSSIEVLILKLP